MKANARKAIAPTQFNPMSTRGHCIMVLEVEMPHHENEGIFELKSLYLQSPIFITNFVDKSIVFSTGMKQRGRVYVCDLAGTEPAGDIYYAKYGKVRIIILFLYVIKVISLRPLRNNRK